MVALVTVVLARPRGARVISPPASPIEARIVEFARSQLGVRTDPPDTYCNPYSAFFGAGVATGCAAGLRAEEWCADFAAWAWHEAGVPFTYGSGPGEIDGAAYSFYGYGLAHGTWHPLSSGYVPRPGDVAVYGLDRPAGTAVHVAVVTEMLAGDRGPMVVNGDGSRTAFSIVETGSDQWKADVHSDGAPLAGYVSPALPPHA